MSILFSLKITEKDKERLVSNYPNHEFIFCKSIKEAKVHIAKAEVIVTFGTDLNEELINQATNLKWIAVLSAGVNEMPLDKLKETDITVTNVRGIHKVPMAEYAISMILQVYRNEKLLFAAEKNQEWERSRDPWEISGKTMLVAGTGAIGQEVARLAKAFNMKTIGVSRSGRNVEYFDQNVKSAHMKSSLSEADFIVSVLPSTSETQNFYTDEVFQSMKDSVVFLNMGRGDVVESDVILKAVQENEVKHVILDVFEEEPLPKGHPLWTNENVTITPHLSGISPHYLERALKILEENLDVFTKNEGEFINQVDVSKGY